MTGLEAFKKAFEQNEDIVKVKISSEYPEFSLRAISAEQDKEIRRSCTTRKALNSRKNQYEEKLDADKYMDQLIIATVVEPNLKSQELQDMFGVMGAEALLARLKVGDYMQLLLAVKDVNGYDLNPEEQNEELKN